MCKRKSEFAEALFPHLVYDVIQSKNRKLCKLLSSRIQEFLLNMEINKNRESIQLILSTLNFIRQQWTKQWVKVGGNSNENR